MKLQTLLLAASLATLPASALLADGQIPPKGAARADAHQAKLNQEQANLRAADNGHLTAADRHRIARQQDRTSQRIDTRNHNAATDPGVPPR